MIPFRVYFRLTEVMSDADFARNENHNIKANINQFLSVCAYFKEFANGIKYIQATGTRSMICNEIVLKEYHLLNNVT